MDQGFWLFFIFQLVALGPLADRINLIGLRRYALLAGIGASLAAALFFMLLTFGGVGGEVLRTVLKWLALAATMGSLALTAASMILPAEMSKKRG